MSALKITENLQIPPKSAIQLLMSLTLIEQHKEQTRELEHALLNLPKAKETHEAICMG